jgi:hypothetical protein
MNRVTFVRVVALLALTTSVNAQNAATSETSIPLDRIFAFSIPGTRDIRELEPQLLPEQLKDLTSQQQKERKQIAFRPRIAEILSSEESLTPGFHKVAPAGFAVAGDPKNALRGAFEVLVEGQERQSVFQRADELNVVFFSYLCDSYIYIREITREGTSIEIAFEVVPYSEKYMTANFALIPLGKLPPNKYQVKVTQLPLTQKFADAGFKAANPDLIKQIVSGSFSFEIKD